MPYPAAPPVEVEGANLRRCRPVAPRGIQLWRDLAAEVRPELGVDLPMDLGSNRE